MESYMNLIMEDYVSKFNEHWYEYLKELSIDQDQFLKGNRLRPCLVFNGFLLNKPGAVLNSDELSKVIIFSTYIEIIHKISIILDDWLDKDDKRHGKTTFHKAFGVEKTVMLSINLISKVLTDFINSTRKYSKNNKVAEKLIDLFLSIIYDMSLGELKELDLNENTIFDKNSIKDISRLETTPLISNSILLGYYLSHGDNPNIEKILIEVGYQCGDIFQTLNDLEPFHNSKDNKAHKGLKNIDYTKSRKNIIVAYLYELLLQSEKKQLKNLPNDEVDSLLKSFIDQYNIVDDFDKEVSFINNNINKNIDKLNNYDLDNSTIELFRLFINSIVQKSRERVWG